jgi:hypothetical protein
MASCNYEADCADYALHGDPMRDYYDHEENARYDRFDGFGDPDNAEEWADEQEYAGLSDDERCAVDAEVAAIQAEYARSDDDDYAEVPF